MLLRSIVIIVGRICVFSLLVLLAWFTVFRFFPWADARLPWGIALLVCYCVVAYIGLPALVRLWQFVHRPEHVPTRSHAGDGWALDPINIVVVAKNQTEFVWAMQKAGWLLADAPTFKNNIRFALAMAFDYPYPHAPFGTHYVFGRRQDLGFQIPVGNSPRHRHHIRFWRLGTTILEDDHAHHGFWRTLLRHFIRKEKGIWVGAAVYDAGLNIRVRTLQLDHAIDSNTCNERDFFIDTLKHARTLKDVTEIQAGEPLHTRHQGFRETIISDGYVKLCEIKRQLLPPPPTDT